jgi:uncharacterized integral membrane protein (TIGR00697 family)
MSTARSEDRQHLPKLTAGAYEGAYLILAALFIAALVACNLIFLKFFEWRIPLPGGGVYVFQQSVGLLAYPVTFLVTDILSEIYGARRANRVVTAGLVASVFVLILIEIADTTTSAGFGTSDATFHQVFGASKIGIGASMAAYLSGQYVDIRLFHFWKRLTRGRHLWLRNNASTFLSQTLDTVIVLCLLASFDGTGVTWEKLPALILNGLLFKWAFALIDTPIFYAAVWYLKRRFPRESALADAAALETAVPS